MIDITEYDRTVSNAREALDRLTLDSRGKDIEAALKMLTPLSTLDRRIFFNRIHLRTHLPVELLISEYNRVTTPVSTDDRMDRAYRKWGFTNNLSGAAYGESYVAFRAGWNSALNQHAEDVEAVEETPR